MKKLIYFIFIFVFICIFCSACNGSVTRDIRHSGYNIGGKFICKRFYPTDKNDTNYDKVKYLTSNNIVDDNGKIYEISMDRVFANDENCKEADTGITVEAIFDNKIIKGTDDKYYYLVGQNDTSSYSEVTTGDNMYYIYDLLLKDNGVVKIITADSNNGSYYILKNDGNIYENIVKTKERNLPPEIVTSRIIYDKGEFGDDIIDFNYAGESLSTYVRTQDKIFRMQITNKKDCTKYADIKCIYSMEEDTKLEKYSNRIIAFNGNTIITDYKQVFNLSN